MNREERLNDPEESLRLAMESQQAQIWTAIPGIVSAVDLGSQTLSVQPSVQGSVASPSGASQLVNLPLLVDVPIVWPRAGGFALTFPIAAGDEVLVVFSSRCIDSWWQSGGVGAPAEVRMHDLSDGFAVLAPTSQPKKLSGVSSTNVQLRDEEGTTYVEIAPGGTVRLVSTTQIDLEAPAINFVGPLNITGPITQAGGAVSFDGIVFGTHRHVGVQTGGGISGAPTN